MESNIKDDLCHIYTCDNNTITNSQLDYAKLPELSYIRICTNVIYLDFAESL